ncbi:terpenoid cyclases/protein prenyltransferase alpha-alpha toroid [Panaeolus papilionaceus]|nr:terpenoid cyclases/protein prenyltransferase alpha-alpha toroid [Panaeolus papilionaceus]
MNASPPLLSRIGHANHCKRCLTGLPVSQTDMDAQRLALVFYCIGSLDLLGMIQDIPDVDRRAWNEWIWAQFTNEPSGSGFRPSPFMTGQNAMDDIVDRTNGYGAPHIIMTYTALLSLAILRDDFSQLNRQGIVEFLRRSQNADGSFSTVPGRNESDLRTLYCAFAISNMLNDWSGIDIPKALRFVASCRTYEGGYGQSPFCEAQGGTTYIAIASLALASISLGGAQTLTQDEKKETIHWLVSKQERTGGFCGRTGKDADACYCFWCGAALKILGAEEFVDTYSMAQFLGRCQFKYGGIAKAPGESADPYHTYLSLAAISMYPPTFEEGSVSPKVHQSWTSFSPLDPVLNARVETVDWIRKHVPQPV